MRSLALTALTCSLALLFSLAGSFRFPILLSGTALFPEMNGFGWA